jgi:fluoride ion exporter CrcB/FEX
MPLALAAFVGGVLGTGLRLAADLAFPHSDATFPASTLGVNVLGALVLGGLVGLLWTLPGVPRWLKVALAGRAGVVHNVRPPSWCRSWRQSSAGCGDSPGISWPSSGLARRSASGRAAGCPPADPGRDPRRRARCERLGAPWACWAAGAAAAIRYSHGRCRASGAIPGGVLLVNVLGALIGGAVLGSPNAAVSDDLG